MSKERSLMKRKAESILSDISDMKMIFSQRTSENQEIMEDMVTWVDRSEKDLERLETMVLQKLKFLDSVIRSKKTQLTQMQKAKI